MKNSILILLLTAILGLSTASAQTGSKPVKNKTKTSATAAKKRNRTTAAAKPSNRYSSATKGKTSARSQVVKTNTPSAKTPASRGENIQESRITVENPKPVDDQKEINPKPSVSTEEKTNYKAALGVKFLWGISLSGKYFFKTNQAVEALLRIRGYSGVGTDLSLGAHYQYHYPLKEVEGLSLYGGGGIFGGYFSFKDKFSGYDFQQDNNLYFGLSAILGAEYKIKTIPLAVSIDWNPVFNLTDSYGGSGFGAENGGIGVKYTF